jgi:hypothetical protein
VHDLLTTVKLSWNLFECEEQRTKWLNMNHEIIVGSHWNVANNSNHEEGKYIYKEQVMEITSIAVDCSWSSPAQSAFLRYYTERIENEASNNPLLPQERI